MPPDVPSSQTERVASIVETLRYVAGSMSVDAEDGEQRERDLSYQAWLIETADRIDSTSPDDWWCCPVCEEAVCDSHCPLAPVRRRQSS